MSFFTRTRSAVAGCLALTVQLLPVSAADLYTVDIVNDSSNSALDDLYVTFIGSAFSSAPTWSGGQSISVGNTYQLSQGNIGTTINNMPTDWGGNLYVGNSDLGGGAPNPTDFNSNQYQIIEFGGNATQASPDITYINWYSFPVSLNSTTSQPSQNRGIPKAGVNLSNLRTDLANLTSSTSNVGNSANTTVVRNSTSNTAAGTITRVVGPSNASGAFGSVSDKYPSFNNYINAAFPNSGNQASNIQIMNMYSGGGSGATANQTYTVTTLTYDGSTLTIDGNATVVGNFTMTASLTPDEFSEVLYRNVMTYAYTSDSGGSNPTGNTGDNNVFSAISRDVMAPFNFGFTLSAAYGSLTSEQQQQATEYFSQIQPDDPFYNAWANVFSQYFDDIYSFPFNDFIADTVLTPTVQVEGGDTLTITLLNEADFVPEPTSAAMLIGGLGLLALRRRQRR